MARSDLKVALGLLNARHVAGDPDLTERLREGALEDWRSQRRPGSPSCGSCTTSAPGYHGELAFLLEPDLKEARGGQRDVHAIQAVAAAWVAPAPGPKVRAAYEQILDARHALHEITGRRLDRLVLEEQDEVARALGLLDGDVLLRSSPGPAGPSPTPWTTRSARRTGSAGASRSAPGAASWTGGRSPTASWSRTARWCSPAPPRRHRIRCCVLRAAAAAAQAGLPLAPRALDQAGRLPAAARPVARRGPGRAARAARRGQAAISVWEALDQEGLITPLIPDWERVRNRPQRNPLHRFTVDRHLVETAANAAALTREVARPDLLLLAALLHDIGKGWPGDHSVSGEVVARDAGAPDRACTTRTWTSSRSRPAPPAAADGGDPPRPG